MPRFMGFVRMQEGVGTPPKALFEAMDEYIGERVASGVFLDGGGLYGTEDAVNYVVGCTDRDRALVARLVRHAAKSGAVFVAANKGAHLHNVVLVRQEGPAPVNVA